MVIFSQMRLLDVKEGVMDGGLFLNLSYGLEALNDFLDIYKRLSKLRTKDKQGGKIKTKVGKIRDSVLAVSLHLRVKKLEFALSLSAVECSK